MHPVACPRAKELVVGVVDLHVWISLWVQPEVFLGSLKLTVKGHAGLVFGNGHFHKSVRHVRREDGATAACNRGRRFDLEPAIVIQINDGKV